MDAYKNFGFFLDKSLAM